MHCAVVTALLLMSGTASVAAAPPEADRSVVMRFGGDCLLAGWYESAAADSPGHAFAGFDLFRTDDLSFVNFESCVTTRGEAALKPYTFRTHPRFVPALTTAGVDLVNLANNHICDYGPAGLSDTIALLDSLGLPHVGAGRTAAEAHAPYVCTIHGLRFAFLGYYRGSEAVPARADSAGVAERSLPLIRRDIGLARTVHGADRVIVSLHWGVEKADRPEPWQRRAAHAIIDAGADAVIGHHPHVLQGIERYHGGIIAYSLGNLIFGGNSRDTYDTALLEVRWSRTTASWDVIPVRVERFRARLLDGEDGRRMIEHVLALSRILHRSPSPRKEHE